MELYVVLKSKKIKDGTAKAFQKALNMKKKIFGFKDKKSALECVQKKAKNSEENKFYVLLVQLNSLLKTGQLQQVIPTTNTFKIFPAKRTLTVKRLIILKKPHVPEMPKRENNGIWIKIGYGLSASAFLGVFLYFSEAISTEAVLNFSLVHGLTMVGANVLVFGGLGIVAATVLSGLFFVLKILDSELLEEKVLNKKEYQQEVTKEKRIVKMLERKLNPSPLMRSFAKLQAAAQDRHFNSKNEPKKQEKQPRIDKLVILQWERKQLENLFEIKDKRARKERESKILKKMKIKFGHSK